MNKPLVDPRVMNAISYGAGVDQQPQNYVQRTGLQGMGLVYTRRGKAEFSNPRNERCFADPGMLTLLRPEHGLALTYGPAAPDFLWETYWVHFEPRSHWYSWLDWPPAITGVRQLRIDPATPIGAKILESMERLCTGAVPNGLKQWVNPRAVPLYDFSHHDLEEVLLYCRLINPLEAQTAPDLRVVRALEFLDTHYASRLRLSELDRVAGLSNSQLTALFNRQVGLTPVQYLERRRIRQAMALLVTSDLSIAEVADAVGYTDRHYFSRRFRRVANETPREYRRRAQASRLAFLQEEVRE